MVEQAEHLFPNRPESNETVYDRKVIIALFTVSFINFSDGTELFLPGVLTQAVTCDMSLTERQHQLLSVVLYASLIVGTFASKWCAEKIGRRYAILVSLCLAMVVAVTAVLSHNFWVLLVSRACVGFVVGSNAILGALYWMDTAKTEKSKKLGLLLIAIAFSVGAGYPSLLAYYTLQLFGWRIFFLVCTFSVYIVPILCVAFLFEKTSAYESLETEEDDNGMPLVIKLIVFLLLVLQIINMFHVHGSILLLPKIYQTENVLGGSNDDECNNVCGEQFLKMALIWGVGRVLANIVGYILFYFGQSISSLFLAAILTTAGFVAITMLPVTSGVQDIMWGIAVLSYTTFNTISWYYILAADVLGGQAVRENAAFLLYGVGKIGAIAGAAVVVFLTIGEMGTCMSILGVIQAVVVVIVGVIAKRCT